MLLRKVLYIFVYVFFKAISCEEEGKTLAFAIDTLSIRNDIDQVKLKAKDIMDIVLTEKSSEIKDFLLVTIQNSDVVLQAKTSSAKTFLDHLDRLNVWNDGNSDSTEMSLTVIEKALQASRPGSYLYVFTNASATDYDKVDSIKSLVITKQTQVVFVLTGESGYPDDRKYTVYYDIAAASLGDVFEVDENNVQWMLHFIKILLKDSPVLKRISVPPSKSFVDFTSVKFTIQETAGFALVTVSGKFVHLRISTKDYVFGPEPKLKKVLWNDDRKVVKVVNPRAGNYTYYAHVNAKSTVSVVIYARTDFTLEHGFTILDPQSHTSKQPTAVEPPETAPNVVINGGKLDIDYGARVTLTCNVTAYPKPAIEWFTTGGVSIPSNIRNIEKSTYVSYVKLENIKNNETYICKATNKIGIGTSKTEVGVRPVFTILSIPTATTTAKYGEDVKIQCKIKSYLQMKIKWFRYERELSNTDVYSMSADGSELMLNSMDLGMEGKYTCKASLISDPTVMLTHETEVKIIGLALPVIEPTNNKIQVTKRKKMELNCKTVGGYPKPHVQWFKKNGSQFELLSHETSEVLTVPRAFFTHAGRYKCVAENVMGNDSVEFEVIMSSKPEMDVGETKKTYPYDSNVQLTCKVESQLPLTIVWMDEKGTVLQNKVSQISEYEHSNQILLPHVKKSASYKCVATNNIGQVDKTVDFEVLSPFNVQEHLNNKTEISYGTEETLRCNIKSQHPMKIQWYLQNSDMKSMSKMINSSNKYSISHDGTELKFNFMDLDMVGKYTCEASLISDPKEKINFSTDVKVVGLTVPEITYSNTVLNGKNFMAICRVKGVPEPIISWQFKPKGSVEFTTRPGSEVELNISELKLSDSGVYRCIAKNVLGQIQHDFDVVVNERPIITNKGSNYFGIEGDIVMQIVCNVTGFPDPTIVWKEGNNTSAIENDSKYVIKGNVLKINNLQLNDATNFTCEAENNLGTATKTFNVDVTDNFQNDDNYYGNTHNIYITEGANITIDCGIVNSETLSVRWYMNGQITKQTGNAYTIEQATVSDDGNYTCRVNTDKGSQSENYAVDVGTPPTFDSGSPSPQTINWQRDEVLDCSERSKPTAKIEWLHDGKKMESLNNIPIHPVTDWGEYTCTVSNVHGSIQRTFKIITSGCYIKNMGMQNMPLISDVNTPAWPNSMSNSDMILKEHEKIKLSCLTDPKYPNAFQMVPPQAEIIAQCHTEDKFIVDGKTYKYKELQCEKKVESSVLSTSEQCSGPHSEIIQVGFGVNGFLDAYEVCFDRSKNVALYASAPVTLTRSENGVDSSAFTWNPAPGMGDGKPTGGFTCGASKTCCYAKGQLLNASELPFGPAQVASFKENLNSVAIWNPCSDNRTSWQSFEEDLKIISRNYETWSSWTGASDYVSKNGGLVPRYLWKVMNYEDDSVVMVYVNDESPKDNDIRCTEPCESMMETADKFLYCCSLDEFSKVFGIPSDSFTNRYTALRPQIDYPIEIPEEV